jgi:hypothetical protein
VTYIRKERDWLSRAVEQGRFIDQVRMLPMLPASVAASGPGLHAGNGHGGNGHGTDLVTSTHTHPE